MGVLCGEGFLICSSIAKFLAISAILAISSVALCLHLSVNGRGDA
jgi:hypothetical protein